MVYDPKDVAGGDPRIIELAADSFYTEVFKEYKEKGDDSFLFRFFCAEESVKPGKDDAGSDDPAKRKAELAAFIGKAPTEKGSNQDFFAVYDARREALKTGVVTEAEHFAWFAGYLCDHYKPYSNVRYSDTKEFVNDFLDAFFPRGQIRTKSEREEDFDSLLGLINAKDKRILKIFRDREEGFAKGLGRLAIHAKIINKAKTWGCVIKNGEVFLDKSKAKSKDQSFRMLMAYYVSKGLVFGQEAVPDKSFAPVADSYDVRNGFSYNWISSDPGKAAVNLGIVEKALDDVKQEDIKKYMNLRIELIHDKVSGCTMGIFGMGKYPRSCCKGAKKYWCYDFYEINDGFVEGRDSDDDYILPSRFAERSCQDFMTVYSDFIRYCTTAGLYNDEGRVSARGTIREINSHMPPGIPEGLSQLFDSAMEDEYD